MGANSAHTAYSSAKFAVKGFTEALITDLRIHAPHVKASVVMPGHVGTSIMLNGTGFDGDNGRRTVARMFGMDVDNMSDEEIAATTESAGAAFRDDAPTTAKQAVQVILDAVKTERWRVLIGDDAAALDALVRAHPEEAYESHFFGLKDDTTQAACSQPSIKKRVKLWTWQHALLASKTLRRSSNSKHDTACLLYTSPSPRDQRGSRMPSSA